MSAEPVFGAFVFRMSFREIRASWRRLLFFFVCIAIGVASIVALRSVIQSVRAALAGEARNMMGADVIVSSNTPFKAIVREEIERARRRGQLTAVIESTEMMTMLRACPPSGCSSGDAAKMPTKMVELLAVEPGYPLYGTLTLQDQPYSHGLLTGRGVLVRPETLSQFGLRVGDGVAIGEASFVIRGVIQSEPGRNMGAFSIGPRVIIDRADLPATGLLSFGARADHDLLLRVPEAGVDALASDLRGMLSDEFVRVQSARRRDDQMGENLTRAEDYLSLVGLVVLILGGIGVSSVTRVFVKQKIRSVAILKCLGGSSAQVLAIYMTQVVLLGLAGCLLGVALAAGVVAVIPSFVTGVPATFNIQYGLTASAVVQGMAVGLLVSVLFAIVPLLDVRDVKPSLLLRQETEASRGFDWTRWLVVGVVGLALVSVATWQAGFAQVALLLLGGLVGVALVLHLVGVLLVRAVQPLRFARSFALRQAVLRVARPGNQTSVILLAVGLGTFFILGVRGLQANLVRDFAVQVGDDAPDMFLLDVQNDQRQGLATYVDERNGAPGPPLLIPVLRARVSAVQGEEVDLDSVQEIRGRGLGREFTITYRDTLEENEELVEGRWWDPAVSEPEVSVEDSVRDRLRIHPGDRMTFNVLGRSITARVANVRRVNWRDFRSGGFIFVFRPDTFANAPHTFMSTARGPLDPKARGELVAGLVGRYPNVSVIDLREMLNTIRGIVENVTLGVTVVGALVLLSGALILVGAVSMTKFRRVYEAAILKTLGANTRLIATMLLLEYGVLGAIAGTVGSIAAIVLSWAVAEFALEMPWEPAPMLTIAGIVTTSILVAAVGVVASLDVLRHKPLATLRAE